MYSGSGNGAGFERGQQSQTGHGQGGAYRSDENNYGRSPAPAQGNDRGRGNEGSYGAQFRRDEDERKNNGG